MEVVIVDMFNKRTARAMHCLAMGINDKAVEPEHEAKSIGPEETFVRDILDVEAASPLILSSIANPATLFPMTATNVAPMPERNQLGRRFS